MIWWSMPKPIICEAATGKSGTHAQICVKSINALPPEKGNTLCQKKQKPNSGWVQEMLCVEIG